MTQHVRMGIDAAAATTTASNDLVLHPSEAALTKLREYPRDDLVALLRARSETAQLEKQIIGNYEEIDRYRDGPSGPIELFSEGTGGPSQLPDGVPKELVQEVKSKVRELHALRQKWWCERQGSTPTARRAWAGQGLGDPGWRQEDEPTNDRAGSSLYQRVYASTMAT